MTVKQKRMLIRILGTFGIYIALTVTDGIWDFCLVWGEKPGMAGAVSDPLIFSSDGTLFTGLCAISETDRCLMKTF